jgi:PEP-CTERM motif
MILIKGVASLCAAMLIGLSAPSAQAGYVVDLTQVGSDVVATGSGAIDLTGLFFLGSISLSSQLDPNGPAILTGPAGASSVDAYAGFTGPANFGSGPQTFVDAGSGDVVGIYTPPAARTTLFVPQGYVSDSSLSDTSTYDNQTFISLGATPGTYTWTWGTGANQNVTLVIGTVVPEPSTWAMMLLGFAGLGLIGYQKRRAAPPDRVQGLG